MSQPSPDAKAVVRAAEALTTQVRRIADALSTPVVRTEVAADDATTTPVRPDFTSPIAGQIEVRQPCPYCGDHQMIPRRQFQEHVARLHPDVRTGGPGIPVLPADEPPTPATTCSAQHRSFDDGRECIRAAHHHGDHIDERGFHWSDTVAVYPLDTGRVRVAHWLPTSEQATEEKRELAGMVGQFIDAQVQQARADDEDDAVDGACWHTEPGSPCDWDRCRQPERLAAGDRGTDPAGTAPLGPKLRAAAEGAAKVVGPFPRPTEEIEDERVVREYAQAQEEQALRWARRESLLVLLTRLQRGRALSEEEAGTLRHHVETEMREADTARTRAGQAEQRLSRIRNMVDAWERRLPATILTATAAEAVRLAAAGDDRPVMFGVVPAQPDAEVRAELEQAQAAIERVRLVGPELEYEATGIGLAEPAREAMRDASRRIRAALDGTEPTAGAPRCQPGPYDDCPNCPHDETDQTTTKRN